MLVKVIGLFLMNTGVQQGSHRPSLNRLRSQLVILKQPHWLNMFWTYQYLGRPFERNPCEFRYPRDSAIAWLPPIDSTSSDINLAAGSKRLTENPCPARWIHPLEAMSNGLSNGLWMRCTTVGTHGMDGEFGSQRV